VLAAVVALSVAVVSETVAAQTYPTRPITIVVPFAGGSASDVVSRIMFDKMSKSLGQPIIVENRPGAGGNTGTAAVAKATPDGYTLVATGSGPVAANTTLYRDLGYDPAKDFEPISAFAYFTIIVAASTKLPVNTLSELIDYAKKQSDPLNYGSVGIGSSQHLAGAYFAQATGSKLTHVPYRNIAQYGPDLIAGTVPLGFQWYPNVAAPLQSGGAKALAVAGKTRMAALPNVPTTAEAGLPSYEAAGWFSLLAPHGTPKPIVAKVYQALAEAIADPAVRQRFLQQGAEPGSPTPEETAKFFAAETVKWRDIIHKAGIPQIQ
jgi:tripartite-type tricarboxylate transporter receptor subunit TctC